MKSSIQNKYSILIRQLFKQRSAGDFRFWDMKGVLFLLVFSFQFNIAAQNGVVINEFASNNISKTSTVEQNLPDWIEFYNPSNQKVNLKGYNLSDDTTNLDKWTFPKFIIPPMGFAVLNLGEIIGTKKVPHFKLSKRGEVFILTNKKGIEIQRIQPIGLGYNQSYARRFDGDADFEVTDSITKGTSNNFSPGILISHQSGFYHQTFNLKLQAKTDCELRYTLNGQLPKANSPVFPDYLEIKRKEIAQMT